MNGWTGCMASGIALVLSGGRAASEPPPTLSITLAPDAPDRDGHIRAIGLTLVVTGTDTASGAPLVRLPAKANTVVTSADDITGLTASDARGPLALVAKDTPVDDSNTDRVWSADRATAGTVTIRYRVTIDPARPPLVAPQYEMRTESSTVSGAANSFVLLPADATPRQVAIHWNLAKVGRRAIGVSSFGVGDVAPAAPITPDRLGSVYYMAGTPGLYRAPGFFGAWQGKPAFAATEVMRWASKLQAFYGSFFGYRPPSFGVFARTNAGNPGSGIGLVDSFAFTFGPTSTAEQMRTLLAHEMLHAWVNSLDGSMDAANGLGAAWFGEGLAVYYQRALPYRAGLIPTAAFLADLNETAGRYYTNAMIATPNADIAAGFWRDTRIRVLPYDRGSLYFASVDAAIRKRSDGRRSLDDIVRAMLAARRRGEAMTLAMWRRMLAAELGQPGIQSFEAMLAGQTVLPPSNAFGVRFERVKLPLRRWQLGFDPASTTTSPKIVRGLIPGSNAALAGLRNGDRITAAFPQDAPQGDQHATLDLKIERDGKPMVVHYLPRGETVLAWQWRLRSPGKR
nr:peptidase M61 [Sphingomonas populi]